MRSREASVNGLYAFGALDAMGFSPFGIESISEPAAKELAASFDLVAQLEPLILSLQGQGKMAGLLSEGPEQRQPQEVRFGRLRAARGVRAGRAGRARGRRRARVTRPAGPPPPSGGLVLATAPDEFIIGGTAVTVTFASSQAGRRVGILSAEEGRFVAGKWENVRWLSGDETHQGRHIRLRARAGSPSSACGSTPTSGPSVLRSDRRWAGARGRSPRRGPSNSVRIGLEGVGPDLVALLGWGAVRRRIMPSKSRPSWRRRACR